MQYTARVVRFTNLTPNVFEVEFALDRPMRFDAGQYVSVVVPVEGQKPLRRPYSIASAPEQTTVTLCVQKIEQGPGSGYLATLHEGDTIEWFGPYGYLVYEPKPNRQAMFIATGTGIAPLRSIIQSEKFRRQPPLEAHVLLGVRNEQEVLYGELSEVVDLKWIACLSKSQMQSGLYYAGRVTDYLRAHSHTIPLDQTEFYLCGNGAMVDEVKRFLKERGVDRPAIHQEVYFRPSKSS